MSIICSIYSAVVPLASFPLFYALGLGWSFTMMGLVVIFLCSIPLTLYVLAERLEGRWGILIDFNLTRKKPSDSNIA